MHLIKSFWEKNHRVDVFVSLGIPCVYFLIFDLWLKNEHIFQDQLGKIFLSILGILTLSILRVQDKEFEKQIANKNPKKQRDENFLLN